MIKKFVQKTSSLGEKDLSLYLPQFYYFSVLSFTLWFVVWTLQFLNFEAMKFILKEDGPSEWLGFFVLFYGSLMAFYLLYKKFQEKKKIDLSYAVLGFLAVGLLFAALEEISYGQRIFNFSSGEFFQSNNSQKETNLHNMVVNGVKVNKLIFGKLLFLAMLIHNLIFPFMVKKLEWAKKLHVMFGNFAPLAPQIIVLIFIALGSDLVDYKRRKEIVEVVGCLFYVLAMVSAFGLGIGGPKIKTVEESTIKKLLKMFYFGVPLSALVMTLAFNL